MLKGHCLCGAIRFEVDAAPTNQTICHCSTCRRAAGSPVVGWFSVPPSAYRVMAGTPAGYRSSPHVIRTFCPACGTPLTYQSTRTPHEIDVTTCSLDDPEAVPPRDHTHASSRLSWIKLADGLPTHAELRPKG